MCGICGEIRFTASPTAAPWEHLIGLMARRGPDDSGFWNDDPHCTFGFRRLAILDLSPAGHQPMFTPDGRYALVYNGEMYNFQPLKNELAQLGWRFRSTGDTEVVLYALVQWGQAALERFNGMFAIGFYDTVERRLLLARDHAGIKPLYYLQHPQGVMFASQYDQIMAHPWAAGLKVRRDALAQYFYRLYIPAPLALLEQTAQVAPGEWVQISADGRISRGRHFTFALTEPDLQGAEAYAAVDAAVTDAVRRQLISDVPIGTFLSGGIDSPLVTAKAAQITNGTLRAYSIGAPGYKNDESEAARRYAEALGVQQVLAQYPPERALDNLMHVVAASSEPFADYSLFPTMLVAELARQDVTVILSGDGGDELFWGYGRTLAMLRFMPMFAIPAAIRRVVYPPLLRALRRPYLIWQLVGQLGDWFRGVHTATPFARLSAMLPELASEAVQLPRLHARTRAAAAPLLRQAEFDHYLPEVLLKVDRGSMYHSLEVRVPLLDKEVIAIAQRIDWRTCVDLPNKLGKLPLRQALRQYTPYQTTAKLGFSVPMEDWLRGALRPIFEERVLQRQTLLGFEFNAQAARAMYQDHLDGRAEFWPGALWTLLSLVLWEEQHQRQPALA